jgi:hypothetical protein
MHKHPKEESVSGKLPGTASKGKHKEKTASGTGPYKSCLCLKKKKILKSPPGHSLSFYFSFFLAESEFEFRASALLGRHSTT